MKYLIIFIIFITNTAYSAVYTSEGGVSASSFSAACTASVAKINERMGAGHAAVYSSAEPECVYNKPNDPAWGFGVIPITKIGSDDTCYEGSASGIYDVDPSNYSSKMCQPKGGGYCPLSCNSPDSDSLSSVGGQGGTFYTICTFTSKTPLSSCAPETKTCDKTNPYGGCYVPPNDNCIRQSNGSIVCPQTSPKNPATPDTKCKFSSTNSYCESAGGACPAGFVPGQYNGKSICVKNANDPQPDPPSDPNNTQGDGSCNGTGNCSPNSNNNTTNNTTNNNTTNQTSNVTNNNTTNNNTTNTTEIKQELDDSGIINAINTTSATIVNTITSKSDIIKNAVDAVKDTADKINDSVKTGFDAVKEKLGIVNDSVKDVKKSVDDAKTQAKADADAALQNQKDFQQWQKDVQNCNPTIKKEDETTSGGFIGGNGQAGAPINQPQNTEKNVNGKLCQFADSFEEYKKWMKGDGKEFDNKPNGNVEVTQSGLDDAINTSKFEGNYVQFSASCPADLSININVIKAGTLKLSYQPFCQLAGMLRPFIIAMAYLSAAFIVLGIGKGD